MHSVKCRGEIKTNADDSNRDYGCRHFDCCYARVLFSIEE